MVITAECFGSVPPTWTRNDELPPLIRFIIRLWLDNPMRKTARVSGDTVSHLWLLQPHPHLITHPNYTIPEGSLQCFQTIWSYFQRKRTARQCIYQTENVFIYLIAACFYGLNRHARNVSGFLLFFVKLNNFWNNNQINNWIIKLWTNRIVTVYPLYTEVNQEETKLRVTVHLIYIFYISQVLGWGLATYILFAHNEVHVFLINSIKK